MTVGASSVGSILKKLKAERVYTERSALSADRTVAELGHLFVAPAGDLNSASRVLEELERAEGITRAYIAPDRDVLVSRDSFGVTGTGSGLEHAWREQIQLAAAELLPQWSQAINPVSVAVVDSGVDNSHPQLTSVLFQEHLSPTFEIRDKSAHGSHVVGLIAAKFDVRNGFGGLAPDCAQVTVHRGLNRPHDVAGYYRALRAASSAKVINLSVGGEGLDIEERDTIADAIANGSIVVTAMGNHADLGNPDIYPACLPDVIAVGAVDRNGERAEFSNSGDHILLSAPGVDIFSTVPTYPVPNVSPVMAPPLAAFSGTSMATPIVTAAIARMLAVNPTLTRAQVIEYIAGNRSSWNGDVGRGVLNLLAAFQKL
jgi:hypothetical protein